MSRPVHIIAVGARCAVGLTAESSAAAIRAGISRIAEHPYLTDATGEKLLCARDLRLDPTIPGPERMVMLAEACLREVVAKTNIALSYSRIGPVLLALPEVRPGFSEQNALFLQQALASCGIPGLGFIRTTHLTAGHAGALSALRLAIEHVAHGGDELCIAGGVDSYLVPATVDWLESDRRLARGGIRCGFPPGEGAAMVVVASSHPISPSSKTGLPAA